MTTAILYMSIAVLFNSVAGAIFKLSALRRDSSSMPLFLVGLAIAAVNTYCYTKSLERIRLSVAYPVYSAATILLLTLASVFLFKEGLAPRQIAGMAVIVLGIVLVSWG